MKRTDLKTVSPQIVFLVLLAFFGAIPAIADTAVQTPQLQNPATQANPPQVVVPAATTNPTATPAPVAPAPSPNPASSLVPTVQGRLSEIDISGNVNISSDAVRTLLREKLGDNFTSAGVEGDRQAIYSMGYFTVVTAKAEQGANSGDVKLTFTVIENPKISKIAFSGNTAFTTKKLLETIQTHEGEVLNTNKLDRDIQAIIGLYRDKGFRASISEDINIDPANGILSIPIIEARIAAIKITNNHKTKTKIITREMKSKPGSLYNQFTFSEDLKRIYNTGIFETVGPADIETPDVGSIVISIPVTERRTGTVSVGVGFSTREQLVGRAELSESNFRGLGETVSVMWEVGGAQAQSSFETSFSDPWIDKHHTGFSVSLYDKVVYRFSDSFITNTTVGNDQYLERHKGALVTFSRPASDTSTVYLTGRTENVTGNDVAVALADNFVHQDADISGLGLRFANNTRDNNFNPAAGGYRSISVEGVTSTAATDGNSPTPLAPGIHNFIKLGFDMRQYISLQGKRKTITQNMRVLAVRFLGGYEAKQTPFSEQNFLGGADSLRGYAEDRFWGNQMLLVNVELRIPIGNSLTGVIFTDAGDAWGSIYQGSDLEQHVPFTLEQAVGVGVRIQTPIGPVRLDYGISRNEGGRSDFTIGQSF